MDGVKEECWVNFRPAGSHLSEREWNKDKKRADDESMSRRAESKLCNRVLTVLLITVTVF